MHSQKPQQVVTVFAGMEREAVAKAREFFKPYQPSSPQIALMKDGKVVFMLERHQIEGRTAPEIADDLVGAFDRYCTTPIAAQGVV